MAPNVFVKADVKRSSWNGVFTMAPGKKQPGSVGNVSVRIRGGNSVEIPALFTGKGKKMPLTTFCLSGRTLQPDLLLDLPLSKELDVVVQPPLGTRYFRESHDFAVKAPLFPTCFREVATIEDSDGAVSLKGKKPAPELASIDLAGIIDGLVRDDVRFLAKRLFKDLLFLRKNLGITFLPASNVRLFNAPTLEYFSWLTEIRPVLRTPDRENKFREMYEAKHGPLAISATVNRLSIAASVHRGELVGSVVF